MYRAARIVLFVSMVAAGKLSAQDLGPPIPPTPPPSGIPAMNSPATQFSPNGSLPPAPGVPSAPGMPSMSGMPASPSAFTGGGLGGGMPGGMGAGMGGGMAGNPLGSGSPVPSMGGMSPLAMAFPPLMALQFLNMNPAGGASPDGVTRLIPQSGRFRTYGWLDAGTIYNTSQPGSGFNGPYNAVDSTTPKFNQAYLVMEMKRPENADFGIGARVDLLYGNDFLLGQSVGFETNRNGSAKWNDHEDYGFAIPQAYLDVGGDELSVQVGHFYTVVGYEGVPSANNFFYSHAYSYQFAGPFTQWGALVTWKPDDNWEIQGGPVNGWNTLDSTQNDINFLGKAKYTSDAKDWWSSFAIITGNQPSNVAGLPGITGDNANRTRYSFLFDRKLSDNLEYIFHQWLGLQQNGTASGSTANWYGIDQYMFYTLNQKWKLGGRFEWFRDEEGTRVGLNRPGNPNKPPLPGNYFSLTVGPNYTPSANVVIRPELRYDNYDGSARPFDDGRKTQQLMMGVDVIVKF